MNRNKDVAGFYIHAIIRSWVNDCAHREMLWRQEMEYGFTQWPV